MQCVKNGVWPKNTMSNNVIINIGFGMNVNYHTLFNPFLLLHTLLNYFHTSLMEQAKCQILKTYDPTA